MRRKGRGLKLNGRGHGKSAHLGL